VQTLTVDDVYVTAKPELAVAVRASVPPAVCAAIVPNVIVCVFRFTVKLCGTEAAAAYVVLPACAAVMVQVPPVTSVAVLPDTVQTPVVKEVYATAKPELAVAVRASVPPAVCAAIVPNVMVCVFRFTVKLCSTEAAAAYVALPACAAVIVQVPPVNNVTVLPATVQTLAEEVYVTAKPELAVAVSASVPPAVCAAIVPKVIVWVFRFTAKLCVAEAAAYIALPACDAVIVQVPAVRNVALVPDTVQTPLVDEANVTANAELAVAFNVKVVVAVCAAIVPKVIVCVFRFTVKLCVAEAGAYVVFPACAAVIVQVPAAGNVTVAPATVQTLLVDEANVTGSPEVAVALNVNGVPAVCAAIAPKVIVWLAGFTVKLCVTAFAAAYVALPGCEAVMVHVPLVNRDTPVWVTVQTALGAAA